MSKLENKLKSELKELNQISLDQDWINNSVKLLHKLPEEEVTESKSRKYINVDILHFIHISMSKRSLLTALSLVMTFMIGLSVFAGYQWQVEKDNYVYLTGAEKDRVLEEIVKNNSTIQKVENSGNNIIPEDYNYSYVRSTWENGPKYDQCKIVGSGAMTSMGYEDTESFEDWVFYGEDSFSSASKTVVTDSEGRIQSIFATNTLNHEEETTYRYEGGAYAIKRIQNTSEVSYGFIDDEMGENLPEVGVNNEISDYLMLIEDFYRQIPNVIKTKEGDYILEYSYGVNCKGEYGPEFVFDGSEKITNNLVLRDFISGKNYQMTKTAVYLDEMKDSNLVRLINYERDVRNTTFEEVSNEFKLPEDINVKEIIIPAVIDLSDGFNDSKEIEKEIMNTINSNKIPVLYSPNGDFQTMIWRGGEGTYVDELYNVTDRDFYSPDDRGERAYQEKLEFNEEVQYSTSLLNVIVGPRMKVNDVNAFNNTITLNFYSKDKDLDRLKESSLFSKDTIKETIIKEVKIGNRTAEMKIDLYESEAPNPETLDEEFVQSIDQSKLYDCKGDVCKVIMYSMSIQFEEGFYFTPFTLNYSEGTINLIIENLDLLEPSNSSDLEQIKRLVRESIFI
jgi:hypothetical protein